MAYNVPSYDTDRFSFGPGILYMGPVGATPQIDIGAVTVGAKLALTREILEYRQGSPATVVKKFAVQENVMLDVTGLEWNVTNLALAAGAGVTASTANEETFEFGGDIDVDQYALRFVHVTPAAQTISIYLWKAEAGSGFEAVFGDGPHEFPMSFSAVESPTNWAGDALATNKRLVKLVYDKIAL